MWPWRCGNGTCHPPLNRRLQSPWTAHPVPPSGLYLDWWRKASESVCYVEQPWNAAFKSSILKRNGDLRDRHWRWQNLKGKSTPPGIFRRIPGTLNIPAILEFKSTWHRSVPMFELNWLSLLFPKISAATWSPEMRHSTPPHYLITWSLLIDSSMTL